jgi:hypothetical protein
MVPWSTIVPVLLEAAPYTIEYLTANADRLGDIKGYVIDLYQDFKDTPYGDRGEFLRENLPRIYEVFKRAGELGFYTALRSYVGIESQRLRGQYEERLQEVGEKNRKLMEVIRYLYENIKRPVRAAATASLIFLTLLGLYYLSLTSQETTIHAIIPMTINIPAIVLSSILMGIGFWLVFRKEN